MQPLGVAALIQLSQVVCVIDVHQQVETWKLQPQWCPSAGFPRACIVISALCLKKHDESEFLLFLFLEQCGSRRLFSTIRPNFVQIRMLSLSSVLQRERSTAYSIWESKYFNHNLLFDFYCLYLQSVLKVIFITGQIFCFCKSHGVVLKMQWWLFLSKAFCENTWLALACGYAIYPEVPL